MPNSISPKCEAARDSAKSYRFIDGINQSLVRAQSSGKYPRWASRFLDDCICATDASKEHIVCRIKEITNVHSDRESVYKNEIATIASAWRSLHDYIQPVVDARIFRIPHELVEFLNRSISTLFGLEKARLIVGITPQLNYFQHRHSSIRGQIKELHRIVKGVPLFGEIGFVSIPFSQANMLILNTILFHEAGHFIFEEKVKDLGVEDYILQIIGNKFPINPHDEAIQLKLRFHALVFKQLKQWFEELFSDLVAVRLIGPAYIIATQTLISLINPPNEENLKYISTHPPIALRLREQNKLFSELFNGSDPLELSSIIKQQYIEENKFSPMPFWGEDKWGKIVSELFEKELIPLAHKKAKIIVPDTHLRECMDDLNKNVKDIKQCLSHATVPSYTTDTGSLIPNPFSTINAAALYWQEGMPNLFNIVEDKSSSKVSDVAKLETMMEGWAGKAIEDWLRIENPKKETKWP